MSSEHVRTQQQEYNRIFIKEHGCSRTTFARRSNPAVAERQRAHDRERWKKSPARKAALKRAGIESNDRLKRLTYEAYGGFTCICCGEQEELFLSLDHVNNDGKTHRKEVGGCGSGPRLYKWLRDREFPPIVQVMCMNCNFGRGHNGGICPHEERICS